MTAEPYSLKARGLVKSYSGRRVVNNVSLSLNQSQIVGLLGSQMVQGKQLPFT